MIQQISSLMLIAALVFSAGTSSMGKEIKESAQTVFEQPYLAIAPVQTHPGDAVLVKSKQATSVTLFQKTYRLQPSNGEYVRFIPVPFDAKPGTYPIQTADNKHHAELTILPKQFAVDKLTVSKQLNQMRQDTARIDADQKKINAARSKSAETAYFADKFQWPAEGRITTPYGYQRVVNGVPANRHAAIDIANKTGTPIAATNHGKVVLAESLYLTGNTVIIDHGLQVFSIYAHMSKIDVKTGDLVKAGQQIGRIGSTGFSTGPHLHFGMLIGNTYVNPQPFLDASPFLWE
ncbi:M23 family metallopeptidase [Brevibacillus borstelensis]|uniref:M23 family metallopeptidase n=1 Tax=Brevibacillus borstelensis TaxID=45462 RepID=UPI00148FF49D|nr:M23 family metallopeptidase [Brevibacillus borstelensis]MED1853902.1 M23 family metallopeptidase [Brevibacillus borstelensis]NOU57568.1 M23 family metallopeptidase [Brevibacillus borstelensis]